MRRALLAALALPCAAHAADPARGREVVLAAGCPACHEVPGGGRPPERPGPSLAGVGERLSAEEIFWWIVDASRFKADTAMPAYGRMQAAAEPRLSTTEIQDAAAFLATLK